MAGAVGVASEGVAVVTGASRGIGLATAIALANRGLPVAMLSRPSRALSKAVAAVSELGRAEVFECDVAIEAQVDRAKDAVLDRMGVPRVVVNNAGIVRRGPRVHETRVIDWDEVMAVNLRGPFLVTRAFLPSMIQAGRGRIVSVGSISATIGSPGAASYASSKWGLVGLVKSLAEELRGTGVGAFAVLPGSVDTDMLSGSAFEPRMRPEDVAGVVVYAALDAPAPMSGAAIEIFG
jgi:NAD(P)-dependent dehydrogenase (short-subunit alcohol dehydrogenase family)